MNRPARGFTLLETLVALSIIGLALVSAMRAVGQTAIAAANLREHAVATWVAENRLAEIRAIGEWPAIGEHAGSSEMAGQTYPWVMKVSGTPNPLFRRVDVEVRESASGRVISRLSGFAVQPLR